MAGFYSADLLNHVRSANDIVELIGSYIPLKRNGTSFTALCPFHKEKSPSFHVNPQGQFFHCFGCHKGGDVFEFVKSYENLSFSEVVRRLAERAKIPLEETNDPEAEKGRHLKEKLYSIHEQITQKWHHFLLSDAAAEPAREYLAKRQVNLEAIQIFRLGYAPDVWDDSVNWAKSKNFDTDIAVAAGLVIHKEESNRFYDRFRGRLMFPICDEQGRVVAFSGRIIQGDEKTAKYVNSPETPIFTKGKIFFGLDKSKRSLLEAKSAVICEGQLDLISCYTSGITNVVAPQGTALTIEHSRILKRYVEEVVLCFDADNAGENATVRSLDSLIQAGLNVRVCTLPEKQDPDSFVKKFGAEALRQKLETAPGFFDFYLHQLCQRNDLSSDAGRVAVVRSMAEAVRKTNNLVLMDEYAQKTAIKLGVLAESTRAEFKKTGKNPPRESRMESEEIPENEAASVSQRIPARELSLLRILLFEEELMDWTIAHLDPSWITHPLVREIILKRIETHQEACWRGIGAFLSLFESLIHQQLITEAATETKMKEVEKNLKGDSSRQGGGVIQKLRSDFYDQELKRISLQLLSPDLDDEAKIALIRRQVETRKAKAAPLHPLGEM